MEEFVCKISDVKKTLKVMTDVSSLFSVVSQLSGLIRNLWYKQNQLISQSFYVLLIFDKPFGLEEEDSNRE
ncbi:CLUMA_CG000734, isoform A [Clunio marinus]|uniref:CLUMA_CG000734, isoform A n=1 Tax=Clunio marinus TaxID=568069 RepID=A0A1J1HL00_9DIPT|nr:CLUMA_CG000734, isoform A [Clunio marinus]